MNVKKSTSLRNGMEGMDGMEGMEWKIDLKTFTPDYGSLCWINPEPVMKLNGGSEKKNTVWLASMKTVKENHIWHLAQELKPKKIPTDCIPRNHQNPKGVKIPNENRPKPVNAQQARTAQTELY